MGKLSNPVESWVQNFLKPRYPYLVQPFLNAVEIHKNAIENNDLPDDSLNKLILYAHNPHKALSENASSMLGELADHFDNARDAIKSLAADSQLHVGSMP
jgi:hypothetical protein